MRDNLSHWNWDEWVCESCFKGDGMLSSKFSIKGDPLSADLAHYDGMHSASSSKSRNYSGWQAHSRRQKAVMSGKVKYISHEEVKQLYSADTKSTSPQKASVGFKTAAPKSPLSRVKASSGNIIRPRRGRPPKMQSISKINQQASEILKHSQGDISSNLALIICISWLNRKGDGCVIALMLLPPFQKKGLLEHTQKGTLSRNNQWMHQYFMGELNLLVGRK